MFGNKFEFYWKCLTKNSIVISDISSWNGRRHDKKSGEFQREIYFCILCKTAQNLNWTNFFVFIFEKSQNMKDWYVVQGIQISLNLSIIGSNFWVISIFSNLIEYNNEFHNNEQMNSKIGLFGKWNKFQFVLFCKILFSHRLIGIFSIARFKGFFGCLSIFPLK